MKVKFIYRNYKKLHTIHSSMVENPPRGVEYVVSETRSKLRKIYPIYVRLKRSRIFIKILEILKDKMFAIDSNEADVDLLHFIQFVPRNGRTEVPYVVDFEHVIGLTDFLENDKFFQKKVQPFLEDKNCKQIIPLSNAADKSLKRKLGSEYSRIKGKIKVVYPALQPFEDGGKKENEHTTFLFVGNHVYRKGLHELLEAFMKIPIGKAKLIVISEVPEELQSKYQREDIEYLLPRFSHEEILKDYFCKADVFVMPTHRDTFGMVFLDALSCGTPVISTNQFAIPEIVEEGKTGFLLETEKQYLLEDNPVYDSKMEEEMRVPEEGLIDALYDKMSYCIENPKEIEKMGMNAKKLFIGPDGKFSIERRNRLLKEIYEKALEIS